MTYTYKISKRIAQCYAALTATALAIAACVADRTTGAVPSRITQVLVTPDSITIDPGATVRFRSYGRTAAGDSVAASPQWLASAGVIMASGLYTADSSPADVVVTATVTSAGSLLTARAQVRKRSVVQVILLPSSASVIVGGTQTFTALGVRNAGDTVALNAMFTATGGAISSGGIYTAGLVAGSYRVIAGDPRSGQADTSLVTVTPAPPVPSGDVLVGAGDIADCSTTTDEATARLLDSIAGTVFTAGDNAYPNGAPSDYTSCYAPTWGRHKARTRPAPGNHDYNTANAAGYFSYFGSAAGDPSRGYYSYDLGAWHLIALNSNVAMGAGSAQEQWLRADLAASTKRCTLAYWHHPRFSSGSHGSSTSPQALWDALYAAGAEVVVSGHDHNYERFAPQTPTGTADAATGIREFIVGTGGTSLRSIGTPIANSEVRNSTAHGVLVLTLVTDAYTWQFVPIAGQSFTDQGAGTCH